MFVKFSYDDLFEHLILDLRDKYDKKFLELSGISDDYLDITKYSKNYFSKKHSADSTIDKNANVQANHLGVYNAERFKAHAKLNSLFRLWGQLKKSYGTKEANRLIELEFNKSINIQDGYDISTPYCWNFATYDLTHYGLPFIKGVNSIPPKHSDTFLQHCVQLCCFAATDQLLGATSIGDILIVYSYLLQKDSLNESYFIPNYKKDSKMFDVYLNQILQQFIYTINQPVRKNQCVTEDTEVLTPNGFKFYNELNIGDEIYTWNGGTLEIEKVNKINVYDYNDEMHVYEGRDVYQQVTPNHRILYKRYNTHEFCLKESKELFNDKTPLAIPIAMNNINTIDYDISDDEIKLLAFILTGGCFQKYYNSNRKGNISIFKSDTRWGKEEIIKIFENLKLSYTINKRKSALKKLVKHYKKDYFFNEYRISCDSSEKYFKLFNGNKKDLPSFLFKLSQRQCILFLESWAKFDGFYDFNKKQIMRIQCDNQIIVDKIQHLCFLAGWGSYKSERKIGNNKKLTLYVRPYINKVKFASKKYKILYNGKVWCPSTNNGVVVFRKNGKIFISGNSLFTNITLFDKNYLEEVQKLYFFDDGKQIDIDFTMEIQKKFLKFFNEYNEVQLFTFPIITAQIKIDKEKNIEDQEFFDFICEENLKFANLNIFASENLNALSSCCRLQSNVEEIISSMKDENTNLIGGSSLKVGSFGVTTVNLPRIALDCKGNEFKFLEVLEERIVDCIKMNHARRELIKLNIEKDQLPLYKYNFINLKSQYSTVGILGFYECIEFFGKNILQQEGKDFGIKLLETIKKVIGEKIKKLEYKINCEAIPGESTSIKFAEADQLLEKQHNVSLYSNQFIPLVKNSTLLDRIELQALFENYMSGGSILHVNVGEKIESKEVMKNLISFTVKKGVKYHAINYFFTKCKKDHITVSSENMCPICGEDVIERYSRIVGFIASHSAMQEERRSEFMERKKYNNESFKII